MLTELQCRAAKTADKALKLTDAQGLHLYVTTSGHKSWRYKYRFGGKERRIVFGPYPEISLRKAREMRDDARIELREGRDPGLEYKRRATRRAAGVEDDRRFRSVATRWHSLQEPQWKARHAQDVLGSLESEVFPAIGDLEISELRPAQIRELLEAVQSRGAIETAHRLRQRISAVFRFAIASGLADMDPAAAIGAALRPVVRGKQPALLKLEDARAFLRAFEAEPGHPTTNLASRLLALTAARPGTIQMAELREFEDLDGSEPIWRIPAEKMKLQRAQSELAEFEFVIPLARQAVETVKAAAMHAVSRKFLFPSARHSHRPITDNALNTAYRRAQGFAGRHVPHGWRATFSTIMNERAITLERPGDRAIIDLMLAHQPDGVESRYNRAAYMPRRRQLSQEWADLLMDGFAPAETLLDLPRR
ncbi:tyrosine-type recombinase/integrase [Sphingomonas sp. IC081]|uniref:tyrosine-type recombinase/integrase n=1 Tax=Sphingomonas sp. IC081 TaxID=304378 RepID=UPI001156FD48|nr:integrase arm-type DNA-binding domain-containing protein [Sphingomonas sp. IC081]QDK32585.1 integrase [Sphingomonas sp. IC081]